MTNKTGSYDNGTYYGNSTLIEFSYLCTLDTCDLSLTNFAYLPNLAGNAIFAAIFGIFFIAQLGLGIKFKTWGYMVAMMFGLILEIIGYVARILVHNSPFDNNNFLMYLICLTIAPAFLTAAIYLCLSRIVMLYGQEISRFKPGTYTIIFCTCDLISLVLQAVGGAIASLADTTDQINLGKNIMLAGLVFQVFSLILFSLLCADFAWRVRCAKGTWNARYIDLVSSTLFKSFLGSLCLATVTISIRSIYRCVELSGGFNGALFRSHEAEFMVLEGVMIVLATGALTLLHPGISFQGAWAEANFRWRSKNQGMESLKTEVGSDIEMGSRKMFVRK